MTADSKDAHPNGTDKHHKKKHHKTNDNLNEDQPVIESEPKILDPPFSKFALRVSGLPIISDSINKVHETVSGTKYGSSALDLAGTTLFRVHSLTQPVQRKLHDHIKVFDDYAYNSMDTIEQKFPLIKMPTDEVIQSVTAKPLELYGGIKTHIDNKITIPASNLAKTVNQRVSGVVDGVESVLDTYLPVEGEHAKADDQNQAIRLYKLSTHVPNRVYYRVNLHLEKHNIPRSMEDLANFAKSNALVIALSEKIKAFNETLNQMVLYSVQATQNSIPPSVAQRFSELSNEAQKQYEKARQHLSVLYTDLMKQLETMSEYIQKHTPALPESVKQYLQPFVEFAKLEYTIIYNEAIKADIDSIQKARGIVTENQKQFYPVLLKSVEDIQHQFDYYMKSAAESKFVLDLKSRVQSFGVHF